MWEDSKKTNFMGEGKQSIKRKYNMAFGKMEHK